VLPCWTVAIPPRSQQLSTVSPSKSGRISVYPKLLQRASINSSMQVFKRNYKSQVITPIDRNKMTQRRGEFLNLGQPWRETIDQSAVE
jgi:hypothetical protein